MCILKPHQSLTHGLVARSAALEIDELPSAIGFPRIYNTAVDFRTVGRPVTETQICDSELHTMLGCTDI